MIEAPRRAVWEAVRDIPSHVEWMRDAEAIRITSPTSEGVGTTYDCDTRFGPLTTTDRMEVVEWRPRRAFTVRHVGVVTGEGRWRLRRARRGRTRFVWDERLRFPWWMGGELGAVLAVPVFRLVWKSNLRRLKRHIESSSSSGVR